jgi:hypothetical protein
MGARFPKRPLVSRCNTPFRKAIATKPPQALAYAGQSSGLVSFVLPTCSCMWPL